MKADPRIFLTGTGGQGTLTSTKLLAQAALLAGIEVVAGEVHGMAQRGGVVESVVLLGGWRGMRLDYGEADILIGFEMLETLRALPYLAENGAIFTSDEKLPPLSVCQGQAEYPSEAVIFAALEKRASACFAVPCHTIGKEAGNSRAGAIALLAAVCASGYLPFGPDALCEAIERHLPAKLQDASLKAARLGAEWMEKNK